MDNTPHFISCTTYSDPNKKILKEFVWKVFQGSFGKDHSIRGRDFAFIGFWTKAGTFYYANIFSPKGL